MTTKATVGLSAGVVVLVAIAAYSILGGSVAEIDTAATCVAPSPRATLFSHPPIRDGEPANLVASPPDDVATQLARDRIDAITSTPALHVHARLVGHDGQPLAGASFVVSSEPAHMPPADTNEQYRSWRAISDSRGHVALQIPGDEARTLDRVTNHETLTITAARHVTRRTKLDVVGIVELALGDVHLTPSTLVTGRVVDAFGNAIADARVSSRSMARSTPVRPLGPTSHRDLRVTPSPISESRTARDGTFALDGIWSGTPTLFVEAAGYAPRWIRDAVHVPRTADNGDRVSCGDIVLDEGWSPRGSVRWKDGEPIEGAIILASRTPSNAEAFRELAATGNISRVPPGDDRPGNDVWWTRSDASGAFQLEGVTKDHVFVHVVAPHVGFAMRMSVTVGSDLSFELAKLKPITFQTVDSNTGEALELDALRAHLPYFTDDTATPNTDPCRIRATRDPHDPTRWTLDAWHRRCAIRGHLSGHAMTPELGDGVLKFERQGPLTVSITNGDEEPIPHARVVMREKPERMLSMENSYFVNSLDILGDASTSRDGVATFTALESATHLLSVEAPGFDSFHGEVEITGGDVRRSIMLHPSTRLRVTLVTDDGASFASHGIGLRTNPSLNRWFGPHPIAPPTISPNDPRYGTVVERTRTPKQVAPGVFVFDGIPPGWYHVTYEPGGAINVEVHESELTDAVVPLRRWPIARGIVLHQGLPVEGVTITHETPHERAQKGHYISHRPVTIRETPVSTTTDEHGRWEMPMRAVTQYVVATKNRSATTEVLQEFNCDETYDLVHELRARTVRGVVVDDNEKPIEGARVYSGTSGSYVTTIADGTFALPWVDETSVGVSAMHSDYHLVMPVPLSHDNRAITFQLQPAAKIAISFHDVDGNTVDLREIKELSCSLRRIDGASMRPSPRYHDGKLSAIHVKPGAYLVTVTKGQRPSRETWVTDTVDVAGAEEVHHTVIIPRWD